MTSPKSPASRASQYGPEYEQLILTVWEKTPFRFPFQTDKAARSMRAKMYSYFRHLREENLRLDLVEIADSLTLSVDGNVLLFQRNSETWDHDAIRNFLGIQQDSFGLTKSDKSELKQPDLLGSRLAKQVSDIRARTAGGQKIVPPIKS